MGIKEDIAQELSEYVEKFEHYDNVTLKTIEKIEDEHKEKIEKFNEKWGEDIFPPDKPIRDEEERKLAEEAEKIKEEKQEENEKIKKLEKELKGAVKHWKSKISERRAELIKNRDRYIEEKATIQKELDSQKEGIALWEKNGINPKDALYQRRKNVVIPNLEKQVNDLDEKLDSKAVRDEYQELGKLEKKLVDIQKHDRIHIIPELQEIFETEEPEKPEPVKPEPVKPEPEKPEPVKPKTAKPESPKQSRSNNSAEENTGIKKIIVIGRKIQFEDKKGNLKEIANSKEFFAEYKKDLKGVYKDLEELITIDGLPVNDLDPLIAYTFREALENDLLSEEEVSNAISAIGEGSKEKLNKVLNIKWDMKDISKGAFWPWNRINRNNMARWANRNKDIMEIDGKYEPNPLKRFFEKAVKAFPKKENQKQITDGSEKAVSQSPEKEFRNSKVVPNVQSKVNEPEKSKSESRLQNTKLKDSERE